MRVFDIEGEGKENLAFDSEGDEVITERHIFCHAIE